MVASAASACSGLTSEQDSEDHLADLAFRSDKPDRELAFLKDKNQAKLLHTFFSDSGQLKRLRPAAVPSFSEGLVGDNIYIYILIFWARFY